MTICRLLTPFAAVIIMAASSQPISYDDASRVFETAHRLCRLDGGRLWGESLCAPMIIADPETRRYLAKADGVQSEGVLPDTVPIANTVLDWQGRRWSMLATPLPPDPQQLAVLVMHEAWHRIQEHIGLPAVQVDEDQLDTQNGRIGLRLELRALAAALAARDDQTARANIAIAYRTRLWRQARFPGSAAREDALERHEGVAEYTGRVLSADPLMTQHLISRLAAGDLVESYAKSFAYFTGPAYGVLLDRFAPGWRSQWDKKVGLASLLAARLGLSNIASPTLPAEDARFGITSVMQEESARATAQATLHARQRSLLVIGPILVLPVKKASFSFNPNGVSPLPPSGSVYATIRTATDWGVLDVHEAGLLSPDWATLAVSMTGATTNGNEVVGQGWRLTLKPGWALAPGLRPGDATVRKAS